MKVFRVKPDVTGFRTLLPTDESIWKTDRLCFDCEPKSDNWIPPELYCFNPKKRQGDFDKLGPGCLVAEPSAVAVVQGFFEMAGELLPVPFEGRFLTILNVIECVNTLDSAKSKWLTAADGSNMYPERYAFHPGRFSASSLFKIPETSRAHVLALEREGDPETDFKTAVEVSGLTGLIFEELWDSEK